MANLTIDASGSVNLSPMQQFQSGGSSSVLSIWDGIGTVQWPGTGKIK